jgi:6-phosphogluconate dehydrogenase
MKVQIKSVLAEIAPQVFQIRDLNEAKGIILQFIETKNIKGADKEIIINNVSQSKHINSIHKYVANSLLKYEGMGIK